MAPDPRLAAKIALQYKLATKEEITECMRDAAGLAAALQARGTITGEQADWLRQAEAYYASQQARQTPPVGVAAAAVSSPSPAEKRPSNLEQRIQKAELSVAESSSLQLETPSGPVSERAKLRAQQVNLEERPEEEARPTPETVALDMASGSGVGEVETADRTVGVGVVTQRMADAAPRMGQAAARQAEAAWRHSDPGIAMTDPTPRMAELAPRMSPLGRSEASGSRLAAASAPRVASRDGRMAALLAEGIRLRASDVHVHTGLPPMVRVDGALSPIAGQAALTPPHTEALAREVMTEEQQAHFFDRNDIDFPYAIPGLGRFRVNAYRQQHGVDLVFRIIPLAPPSLEELGLPDSLGRFTGYFQGLVLCTGPAGCGKSTTMAALLDRINKTRNQHIITVEDPIEFVHASKKCLVRQRQVITHTESFGRALRSALREDPNVIGIGELRDHETTELALTASETGNLVFGTLPTNSAIRTVNRVIDAFPPEQQPQVRLMFSQSLKGVISQRLVRRADGRGRVAALEVLLVNHAVANMIRDDKVYQLRSAMQVGRALGMRLLDDSLRELVDAGTITRDEARLHAEVPAAFAG